MIDLHPNSAVLVFDEFLAYLRLQGFIIGIDHYLRLQDLLNKVKGECAPSQLKTLLCPIFATSQMQQEKFYTAFDSYFGLLRVPALRPEGDNGGSTAERTSSTDTSGRALSTTTRRLVYPLTGASIVVVAIALAFFLIKPPSPPNRNSNMNGPANLNQPSNSRQDNNSAQGNTRTGNTNKPPVNANANTPANQTPAPTAYPNMSKSVSSQLRGPGLRSALRIGAVSIPLLFFFIYEWYRYKRRKLVLQKQRINKPPFVYTVRIESPVNKIFNSVQFYTAARRMRRRQTDKFQRLDVKATVSATIGSLGFPTFKYKPDSKVPEYLILIDRASFRDHQAQFFENLANALKQEGLYVTSYFYDGDPRVCSNARGEYAHLADIQNRYGDNRLLVVGNGEKMIDPLTGELESWGSAFSYWQDRALLTPEPPSRWGLREKSLSGQFTIVPADLDGLLALVEYFETGITTDHRLLMRNGHGGLPRELDQQGAMEQLRGYLGEKSFQWLCACAVYPELQWGLTLYLGSLPGMGEGLIKEENLLRLAGLPWFRNGSIPDPIRLPLISALDKEKGTAIRTAIVELLEHKSPTPKAGHSATADAYELNLAVQKRLLHFDDKGRGKLRSVKVKLQPKEIFQDYTLIRFLESAPMTRLALLLPKRLRAIFYSNSMPEFGLRTSVRFGVTLTLIAALWLALNWAIPGTPRVNILGFKASQNSIIAGETVSLWYGVNNASSARIDPEPKEVGLLEENIIEVEPTETTTYQLTATDGNGGSVRRELTVEVVPDTALRIAAFTADPSSVLPGEAAALCYEIHNASGYKIVSDSGEVVEDSNAGGATLSDRVSINCIKATPGKQTTYTLTATADDGSSDSRQVSVEMANAMDLRITSFQAEPATIMAGDKTRLCYDVNNASDVKIVSNFGEAVATRANCATVAPGKTTIYTMTAIGQGNQQQQQSITIRVLAKDKIIIKSFTANPSVVDPGRPVQLCHEVINADGAQITSVDDPGSIVSPKNGCLTVKPEQSATYTLKAYHIVDSSGQMAFEDMVSRTVSVKVNTPSSLIVTVDPDTVAPGESARLCVGTKSSVPLSGVKITPPPGPSLPATPSRLIVPLDCYQVTPKQRTTYNVTAIENGKPVSQQITVEVVKPPAITLFTPSQTVITEGETVEICYGVMNADKVVMNTFEDGQLAESEHVLPVSERHCFTFVPHRTARKYELQLLATNKKGESDSKRIGITIPPSGAKPQDPSQNNAKQAPNAARNSNKAPTAMSDVRIQVTGGEEKTPIKGATVYMEWQDDGETKRKEGLTNLNGIAGPYQLTRGKVFIQITTNDAEWERKGSAYDLKDPEVTITVNLARRAQIKKPSKTP